MARTYLMSWIGSQERWMKMYRGWRHAVSCRQLGVPPTKEGSWRAANEWWERKRVEVDASRHRAADPVVSEVVRLLAAPHAKLPFAVGAEIAPGVLGILREVHGEPLGDPDALATAARELIRTHREDPLPAGYAAKVLGEEQARVLHVGLAKLPGTPDRTMGGQVDRWVGVQRAMVGAGEMTPDRADNTRICLYHFRDFVGATTPLDRVGEEALHNFFLFCLGRVKTRRPRGRGEGASGEGQPARRTSPDGRAVGDLSEVKAAWSVDYAKKVFGVARSFIRFLWESRLIELPRNIDSKVFKFGSGVRAIPTWTVDEFGTVLAAATGQFKLHLLLMANCGMQQTDIADLMDAEVDWGRGRIRRRRSKTDSHEDVPVVDYKLWPLTFELLKKYCSGGETVLLTERGRRWVDKRLVGGKLVKADNVASCYAHLKKRLGFRKPLKQIRKTSASLLESHPEYGRYKSHFLGHSPRTVADRHYAAPSADLFDKAVAWLGEQYGLCPNSRQSRSGRTSR